MFASRAFVAVSGALFIYAWLVLLSRKRGAVDLGDGQSVMSVNIADGHRLRGSGLPKCYTIKTVAEALDVSPRTIRRWIASGDLVVHRVDGVVRISDGDLRVFLAAHRDA
jgi:excisionase family DNA binding protein